MSRKRQQQFKQMAKDQVYPCCMNGMHQDKRKEFEPREMRQKVLDKFIDLSTADVFGSKLCG